jgi:hypothetical protein
MERDNLTLLVEFQSFAIAKDGGWHPVQAKIKWLYMTKK